MELVFHSGPFPGYRHIAVRFGSLNKALFAGFAGRLPQPTCPAGYRGGVQSLRRTRRTIGSKVAIGSLA
jgi:hypothetical protein